MAVYLFHYLNTFGSLTLFKITSQTAWAKRAHKLGKTFVDRGFLTPDIIDKKVDGLYKYLQKRGVKVHNNTQIPQPLTIPDKATVASKDYADWVRSSSKQSEYTGADKHIHIVVPKVDLLRGQLAKNKPHHLVWEDRNSFIKSKIDKDLQYHEGQEALTLLNKTIKPLRYTSDRGHFQPKSTFTGA